MPLIRYKLGDSGVINTGQTGSKPFDFLEEITGRTDDMVVTTSGKLVGRLDPVFKSELKIKEAQIIQEDYSSFIIRLAPDKDFSDKDTASIESRLKDRVGNDIKVTFEIVDQIPRGANGKFKAVISKVSAPKN
jgi:phenylacetate-CoA ligase